MVGEAYMIARMLQIVHIIKVIRPNWLDKGFLSSYFRAFARFRGLVAGFLSPRTGTDSRPIYLIVVVDKAVRENSFSPNNSVLSGQDHHADVAVLNTRTWRSNIKRSSRFHFLIDQYSYTLRITCVCSCLHLLLDLIVHHSRICNVDYPILKKWERR